MKVSRLYCFLLLGFCASMLSCGGGIGLGGTTVTNNGSVVSGGTCGTQFSPGWRVTGRIVDGVSRQPLTTAVLWLEGPLPVTPAIYRRYGVGNLVDSAA